MCLLQVNLIIVCIIQTLLWTVPLRKALSLEHDVNPYNYIYTKPIMWENYLCPGAIHTGPTYVQTDLQTANRFQKNSVSSKSQWARENSGARRNISTKFPEPTMSSKISLMLARVDDLPIQCDSFKIRQNT